MRIVIKTDEVQNKEVIAPIAAPAKGGGGHFLFKRVYPQPVESVVLGRA